MLMLITVVVIVLSFSVVPPSLRGYVGAALDLTIAGSMAWQLLTWRERSEAAGELLYRLPGMRGGRGLVGVNVVFVGFALVSLASGNLSADAIAAIVLPILALFYLIIFNRSGTEVRELGVARLNGVTDWDHVESFRWDGFMGNSLQLRIRTSIAGIELPYTLRAQVPFDQCEPLSGLLIAKRVQGQPWAGSGAMPS